MRWEGKNLTASVFLTSFAVGTQLLRVVSPIPSSTLGEVVKTTLMASLASSTEFSSVVLQIQVYPWGV